MTNIFALFRIARFWFTHSFLLDTSLSGNSRGPSGSHFSWVAKVLNNVKCSTNVEKSYIIMTASDFLGQNTCTKDRSFLWQRIESASKIDTDRCHKLLGARLEWGPLLGFWAPLWTSTFGAGEVAFGMATHAIMSESANHSIKGRRVK